MSAAARVDDEKMSAPVGSGMARCPKPSMASGNEMKEPILPSFITMRGPAQTRSSSEGASLVMFMASPSCWAVQAVKLCQALAWSSPPGETAAATASGTEGSTMALVQGHRRARSGRGEGGREGGTEQPRRKRDDAGRAGNERKGGGGRSGEGALCSSELHMRVARLQSYIVGRRCAGFRRDEIRSGSRSAGSSRADDDCRRVDAARISSCVRCPGLVMVS